MRRSRVDECHMSAERILIFAPHPDDETLGCGGLIQRKLAAGSDIRIHVITDGRHFGEVLFGGDPSPAEVARRRREESRRAVAILGLDPATLAFGDIEDGRLDEQRDAFARIAADLLRRLDPAEVYCTSPYEAHRDHRAAAEVLRGLRGTGEFGFRYFEYFVALPWGMSRDGIDEEQIEFDLGPAYDVKARAAACFECHLRIVSPHQTEPACKDMSAYVHRREAFLVPR